MSETGWEPAQGEFPTPPHNVQVVSPYLIGAVDVRWDDPALLTANTSFTVVGVNVYRAYNDRGPYHRVNPYPIGGNIFRDFTENVLIQNEIIPLTSWVSRGDGPAHVSLGAINTEIPHNNLAPVGSWVFNTEFPIVKQCGQKVFGNSYRDVWVTVNGVVSPVVSILGSQGRVTLQNIAEINPTTEAWAGPVLPFNEDDEVLVCYYANKNLVKTVLAAKPVYRVTTVTLDPNNPTGLFENPLNYSAPVYLQQVETIDYMWKEAIRRNNWMLQQGGERVKLFVKKVVGEPCPCYSDPLRKEVYKQPKSLCVICFGTGYIGGYDGPFEVIVSPDNEAKKVAQRERGRTVTHVRDVFMGPSPLLTTRDFLVKQTNERYTVGEVMSVAVRGAPLQQHFPMSLLDEGDIRYKVPIDGTTELPWPETRGVAPILQGGAWPVPPNPPGPYPVGEERIHPVMTEKPNIPNDREIRGRTRTSENITY